MSDEYVLQRNLLMTWENPKWVQFLYLKMNTNPINLLKELNDKAEFLASRLKEKCIPFVFLISEREIRI